MRLHFVFSCRYGKKLLLKTINQQSIEFRKIIYKSNIYNPLLFQHLQEVSPLWVSS